MRGDTIIANYPYLSDGTKLSASDGEGHGLAYLGSLVYRKQGETLQVESAGFSEGRFVATNNGFESHYYITDHLGSTRVVVNGSTGEVVERSDYYPFGMTFAESSFEDKQPYKYNGKELDYENGLNLYDYGARYYDDQLGRFGSVDRLAEKYFAISPYAYCTNNPIKYVDPNGMEIAESSKDEWERQKASIQRNVDRMQNRMDKLVSKGASESRIANMGERIAGVRSTLGTMGTLEASTQVYALGGLSPEGLGGLSYNHGTGVITIGYSGTANFVHEITHGGQFEAGSIGLDLVNPRAVYGQDVYDEVAAYQAQYAYSPGSVSGLPSSSAVRFSADITTGWVQGIVHKGERIYNPGTSVNTGLYPVNVNSTRLELMRAYPRLSLSGVSNTMPFRNIVPMHYKR